MTPEGTLAFLVTESPGVSGLRSWEEKTGGNRTLLPKQIQGRLSFYCILRMHIRVKASARCSALSLILELAYITKL